MQSKKVCKQHLHVPSETYLNTSCIESIGAYTNGERFRFFTVTDHKGKHSRELPSDMSLPHELNHFYARFEASNTEACMRASAVPDDCVITLSVADVSKTFK